MSYPILPSLHMFCYRMSIPTENCNMFPVSLSFCIIDVQTGRPAWPWHGPYLARPSLCHAQPGPMPRRVMSCQPMGYTDGPGKGPRAHSVPGQPSWHGQCLGLGPLPRPSRDATAPASYGACRAATPTPRSRRPPAAARATHATGPLPG